jgi:hypothetical protein
MVDGLILTLFSLFRDLNYHQLLVDCLKRLVTVPRRGSVCETIQRKYTGVNQQEGQVKVQVAEDTFTYHSGTDADRVDLGCRQLVALAMRDYPYMPRDPIRGDAVNKATTKADPAVLRRLAGLAYQLGFETPQIHTLRQLTSSRIAGDDDPQLSPLYVTSGRGVEERQRSGIPHTQAYREDRCYLFINHLHDTQAYHGEGITSLFVPKSVYLAFFGKPDKVSMIHSLPNSPSGSGFVGVDSNRLPNHDTSQSQGRAGYVDDDIDDIVSSYNRREDTSLLQGASEDTDEHARYLSNQERLEQERQEQERQEQEILELRRIEETLERDELQERLAAALQAQDNMEREKQRQQEQEKQAQERDEEEARRQETRGQRRRKQEETVQGSERRRKRGNTQIDMESAIRGVYGNQSGLPATQAQESSQALVPVSPSSTRDPQPRVNDQISIEEEGLALERSKRNSKD